MKLTDLDASFVRCEGDRLPHVETLAEAQGVWFLCPKCYAANDGVVGTHYVLCWFRDRGVPDDAFPRPGRWGVSGTGLHDLTLHPSVNLPGADGCEWHGWVKNGDAA